jgi:hypothetical protein
MLDPQQLAWGLVLEIDRNDLNSPQYLIYEAKDGGVKVVPVKSGSLDAATYFWRNSD